LNYELLRNVVAYRWVLCSNLLYCFAIVFMNYKSLNMLFVSWLTS